MKKLLFLLTFLLIGLTSFSQSKEFNKVEYMDLKYTGALNGPDGIVGYYFFYKYDKASKEMYTYIMNLVDINLNTIKEIRLERSNYDILLESTFNGNNFFFTFLNKQNHTIEVLSYTKDGEIAGSTASTKLSGFESQIIINNSNTNIGDKIVYNLGDKGILKIKYTYNNKKKYTIEYLDNNLTSNWVYTSDLKENYIEYPHLEYGSENLALLNVLRRSSLMSREYSYHLLLINTKTGKKIFETPLNKKEAIYTLQKSFIDEMKNEIVLIGEYFDINSNPLEDKSLGVFSTKIDLAGNIISTKEIAWSNIFNKITNSGSSNSALDQNYTYFQDVVRTKEGKYFIIGEQLNKTAAKAKVPSIDPSGGNGGGANNLILKDIVLIEFDSTFALQQSRAYSKNENAINLPGIYSYLPLVNTTKIMNGYGYFDYKFTNVDTKRNRFFSSFVSAEVTKKNEKTVQFIGTITYDKDISFDKLSIISNASSISILPAKSGYLTIMEYFKKEKKVNFRIEKINP